VQRKRSSVGQAIHLRESSSQVGPVLDRLAVAAMPLVVPTARPLRPPGPGVGRLVVAVDRLCIRGKRQTLRVGVSGSAPFVMPRKGTSPRESALTSGGISANLRRLALQTDSTDIDSRQASRTCNGERMCRSVDQHHSDVDDHGIEFTQSLITSAMSACWFRNDRQPLGGAAPVFRLGGSVFGGVLLIWRCSWCGNLDLAD